MAGQKPSATLAVTPAVTVAGWTVERVAEVVPSLATVVRTPWTLSSEVVWAKTNLLVGRIMMVGGLVVIATSPLPAQWSISAILVLAALLTVFALVYSWWLYTRLGPSPR